MKTFSWRYLHKFLLILSGATTGQQVRGKRGPFIGRNAELTKEWVNLDLASVTDADLAAWIPYFVLEVRNKNGEPYPPNTLCSLVMGLQCQLRSKARPINLLTDARIFQVH